MTWLVIMTLLPCSLFSQVLSVAGNEKPGSVVSGQVRFSVITPTLIRMEWDSSGIFEDRPSLVVINRTTGNTPFISQEAGDELILQTSKFKLYYKTGSGKFIASNLRISYTDPITGKPALWTPGQTDPENLKGTWRTLDGCDGQVRWNGDTIRLEDGILSRSGWYLLNDSERLLFDDSEWPWATVRPKRSHQDWYFFCYGHDYKQALKDFTLVAGKIPMPPRWAFGYWWSRYWSYTDEELREIVLNFERFGLPVDVLVIDMDWHKTDGLDWDERVKKDEFGQEIGWTGFTWNRNLFPEPEKFLSWTKARGLKVTMNLHPASGVAPWEEKYAAFAEAMDFDTNGHRNIPFEIADKNFVKKYFDILLHPLEKQGVDFWWIDWQQWRNSKQMPSLSNTWWLNYCHFTDMERQGEKRPILYHRWGGLGNHRYQIGFSGDTYITWQSLAFQPYFTSTASNVGYGYWSHDIGGHMLKTEDQVMNPELSTRWMQFGVFSPILRNHSTKNPKIFKEPWLYPFDHFVAMHDAIGLRYELVPYIYNAARKAYDEGISLCRPMYYDYPEQQEAYRSPNQYMFGDWMIVAPVISPAPEGDPLTTVELWLPEGRWIEWATGSEIEGGKRMIREFLVNEIPVYVKAGSIIPGYPKMKNLAEEPGEMLITVFPGPDSEYRLYEDDGVSNDYTHGAYAITQIATTHRTDGSLDLKIAARKGSYKGMPSKRTWHIRLINSLVPGKIVIGDKEIKMIEQEHTDGWYYSAGDLSLHIIIPDADPAKDIVLKIDYSDGQNQSNQLAGKAGLFRRYAMAGKILKIAWGFITNGPLPAIITQTEQTPTRINYNPATLVNELKQYDENLKLIPGIIREMKIDEISKTKVRRLLSF